MPGDAQGPADLEAIQRRLEEVERIASIGSWEWSIPTSVDWADSLSGGIYWSKQMRRIYGIGPDAPLRFEDWYEAVHPEDRQRAVADVETAVANGTDYRSEFRVVIDGRTRRILSTGEVHTDDEGRPCRMVGTDLDVTELRRAEGESRQLSLRIEQAQRLESLGLLAGGIAHDFNNLLFGVLGNVEILARLPAVPEAAAPLARIQEASERARDLAGQLLAYAGAGPTSIQRLDLGSVVASVRRLIDVSISRKVVLDVDLAADLPAVDADAGQIHQVVMNLILNASEALGSTAGRIAVQAAVREARRRDLDRLLHGPELAEGSYVELTVADSGPGFDESIADRIFDPFYSTRGRGRGLGLAIVQGLVRRQGGAIGVESRPGQGTTFSVLLPVATGRAATTGSPDPAPARELRTGLVLLVDDEHLARETATDLLDCLGFEVVTASDSHEALTVLESRREEIACVVLDFDMPNLDGRETLAALRRIDPGKPVILSSGFGEPLVSGNDRDPIDPPQALLPKPYRLEDLRTVLAEVLGSPDSDGQPGRPA